MRIKLPSTIFFFVFLSVVVYTPACIQQSSAAKPIRCDSIPSAEELFETTMPPKTPSYRKEYTGFALDFNKDNHTPNYVAWEVLATETDGECSRKHQKFWQDDMVPGCPHTKDYSNSGYDRGHLFPAADAKWSAESMSDCFVMANMAPQVHSLNNGAWKTLEGKEREWAVRDSAIVVIAGPIYSPVDNERIGANKVRVPSAYFKVLLAPWLESPRAVGFVYPNAHCPGNMRNYSTTVDEVERLTGFDFFSALPDELENAIEAENSVNLWMKY